MITDKATREAIEYVLTRGVVQVEKDAELRRHQAFARTLARGELSKRYRNGSAIFPCEFMYRLLQGYGSVALHADGEIGGTDQTSHPLVGRELRPDFGQPSQQLLTVQRI